MYHKSVFNYIYEKSKNNWIIYNTFSGSIIIINDETKKKYDKLDDRKIKNSNKFVNDLINQGILVDNNYDEKKISRC